MTKPRADHPWRQTANIRSKEGRYDPRTDPDARLVEDSMDYHTYENAHWKQNKLGARIGLGLDLMHYTDWPSTHRDEPSLLDLIRGSRIPNPPSQTRRQYFNKEAWAIRYSIWHFGTNKVIIDRNSPLAHLGFIYVVERTEEN